MSYSRIGSAEPLDLMEIGKEVRRLSGLMERDLAWRRVATVATVAGALFAAVRLTEIWFAVRASRKER